jgi:hypothetical protein
MCLWFDQWFQWNDWHSLVKALAVIGGTFLAAIAAALTVGLASVAASAIVTLAVAAAEATAGRAIDEVFQQTFNTLFETYLTNNAHDPNFGVETMQRFHYVVSPQTWDLMSFMTFHFAFYGGQTIQVVPLPGWVIPLSRSDADTCFSALLEWTSVYPLGTWVWIGPLEVPE